MTFTLPHEDVGLLVGIGIAVYGVLTMNTDITAAGLGIAGVTKALGSATSTPSPASA